jgi:DNA-binding IclR family transcriptional regulator
MKRYSSMMKVNKIKDFVMAGSNLVQSVLRGTEIVEAIAQAEDGLTLNEISVQVDLKTTTVYNILRTFCASGWLKRDSDGKYFIGVSLLSVVRNGNGSAVLSQAVPVMLELSEQFPGGTLTFAEFANDGIWCRLRVSPDRPGVIQRRMLQRFMPYASATGLLFQAFMSEDEFAPAAELYSFSEYGLRLWNSEGEFEKCLAKVRENGYASSPEVRTTSLAIALPVHGDALDNHELRYALGISFKNTAEIEKSEVLEKMQAAVKNLAKFI